MTDRADLIRRVRYIASIAGPDWGPPLTAAADALEQGAKDAARYRFLKTRAYPSFGSWHTQVDMANPTAPTPPAHYQRDFEHTIDAAIAGKVSGR